MLLLGQAQIIAEPRRLLVDRCPTEEGTYVLDHSVLSVLCSKTDAVRVDNYTSKKHWYIGSDCSLASSSTATEWLLQ